MAKRKKTPKQERHEAWKRIRKAGMWPFVLRRGVLGFGPIFSVLMVAIQFVTGTIASQGWTQVGLFALMNMVVGGTLWGLMTWFLSESNYSRTMNRK